MFSKVKFSLTTDHPPLPRFSYFEWWLCGWGTFGIFTVMVKRDNKRGLNITCICQLVSSVESRLFRGLVRILAQLIYLVIEHKVLHQTLAFIVVLWLMEGPRTKAKRDGNIQAMSSSFYSIRPILFATEWIKLVYLLKNNWACKLLNRKSGFE